MVGEPALRSIPFPRQIQNMKISTLVLLTALCMTGCHGREEEGPSKPHQESGVMNFAPTSEMPYKK